MEAYEITMLSACMYVCMYACRHVYVCVYGYVCVCTYVLYLNLFTYFSETWYEGMPLYVFHFNGSTCEILP